MIRRRGRAGRGLIPLFLLAAVGLCAPRYGFAQEEKKAEKPAAEAPAAEAPAAEGEGEEEMDEEERAAKYFADGSKAYTEGKYQDAIGKLLKAYELRPAPPILLNIARTYEKLDDKRNALKFYKEFLLKARMVDPNRPMVEKVVAELEKEVGGGTGAVTSAAGTETPGATTTSDEPNLQMTRKAQLIHTPVDAGTYKKDLIMTCETPPDVDASSVIIFFRRAGEMKFRQVGMDQQGEAWVGQIPARYITTTSLQYYIEAYQRKGDMMRVAAVYSSKRTPNIVVIEGAKVARVKGADPDNPEGGDEEKSRGPSSPWIPWVIVGGGVALAGAVVAGILGGLAMDRANAVEKVYMEKSCTSQECRNGYNLKQNLPQWSYNQPIKQGGESPQDWEKQGKTFSDAMWGGVALGVLGAAAVGTFLALHFTWKPPVEDDTPIAKKPDSRFTASPWVNENGGGFVGRIDF